MIIAAKIFKQWERKKQKKQTKILKSYLPILLPRKFKGITSWAGNFYNVIDITYKRYTPVITFFNNVNNFEYCFKRERSGKRDNKDKGTTAVQN